MLATTIQDLRYAARTLRRSPGFTAVAVLTLAVGIGATTAIYSAVRTTILDPLPVRAADRLMKIESFNAAKSRFNAGVSPPAIRELRRHQDVFAELAVCDGMLAKYRGGEFIDIVKGLEVSPSFFELWRVRPLLGRVFTPDEQRRGAGKVVVLSHAFWRSRLGGDPEIVGKSVELDAGWIGAPYEAYTVIGVMPAHFVFPHEDDEYWVPMADPDGDDPYPRNYGVFVRLADQASTLQARQVFDLIAAREVAADPIANQGWRMRPRPVTGMFADDATRQRLWSLLAVIALVWVIACANVANLLVARAEARRQELAIRASLGASPSRLLRQLLTESFLLAVAGGLCGLVVTAWGLEALRALLGGIRLKPMGFDAAVFACAAALSGMTAVVFGTAPAWRATRARTSEALKQSGPSSTQALEGRWLVRGLIVAEVALTVVALAAAGLMVRSTISVLRLNVGYDARDLILAVAVPSAETMKDTGTYAEFIDRLGRGYEELPGVQSVGIRTAGGQLEYVAEGQDRTVQVRHEGCGLGSRNLFTALRVPLLEGRYLDRSDLERTTVLVNRTLARTLWPNEKAAGKRFRPVPAQTRTSPQTLREGVLLEVVGVVGDTRLDDHETDPPPTLYRPCRDFYDSLHYDRVYVRASGDPASLIRPIHSAMTHADAGVTHRVIRNVAQELYRSTQGRRFFTLYLALYAAVGLALTALGVYGLIACAVQRRTREFGIRMALGATRARVSALAVKDALSVAVMGLGVGLAVALSVARLMESQVHGVTPRDPATLAVVSAVILMATVIACAVPAYRATRIEPMEALRDG
jgi:putative ABC transport system permease protein